MILSPVESLHYDHCFGDFAFSRLVTFHASPVQLFGNRPRKMHSWLDLPSQLCYTKFLKKLGKIAKREPMTTRWKGSDVMRGQQINHISGKVLIALSLIALVTVLSGYTQPPQPDEGAGAHIFQLSIVALVPMILLFLATADWKQPWRSARPLAFPAAALVLAFGALYYLEHYR